MYLLASMLEALNSLQQQKQALAICDNNFFFRILSNFYSCIQSTKDHNGKCSTDVQVEIEASEVHLSESVSAG